MSGNVMVDLANTIHGSSLYQAYNQTFAATSDTYTWIIKTDPYSVVLPFSAVTIYFFMVHYLGRLLPQQSNNSAILKWIMVAWNFFLSIASAIMFVTTLLDHFVVMYPHYGSVAGVVCDRDYLFWRHKSPLHIFPVMFVYSKFAELLDTVFLIMKHPQRKVPFLHWYHHITVLLFSWYALYYEYSTGIMFVLMNTTVHTFMYYYYALAEMGIRVSWGKLLTIGQIGQMLMGVVFSVYYIVKTYENEQCACTHPSVIITSSILMYSSYLYLFVKFFVEKYILQKNIKKNRKAE